MPLLHNTTTSHLYLCLYFYLYLLECVEVVVEEWPPLHNINLCSAATVPSSSGSKSDRQKFSCLYFLLQCICSVCLFAIVFVLIEQDLSHSMTAKLILVLS